MSLVSPLSLEERALVAAVFGGSSLSDMDRIAFGLAASGDLAFWGGKTLKSWSERRYVFNGAGDLCRIQEKFDGAWLTIARADEGSDET